MYRLLLVVLMGSLLSSCAAYTATSGRVVLKDDSKISDIRLSDNDRALIAGYYQKFPAHKKASDTAKLTKGRVLPSAVQSEPLPRELEQKLSSLPYSHARVRAGPYVLLMEKKTRVIADVFYGVAK